MNYLLQNRSTYYEFLLARIPDLKLRTLIKESISVVPITGTLLKEAGWPPFLLLNLSLEDAVKKPLFGEKMGKTVVSVHEGLVRAIHFEDLCVLYYTLVDQSEYLETINYHILAASNLRKLADDLRYHRVRLIETR